MPALRIVRSDDPAAAPVLAGLSREYSERYGAVVQDAPYGRYRDHPRCVCFEKRLTPRRGSRPSA